MKKWLAACVAVMSMGGAAQAHYVWLERTGTNVRAYFGEWEGDLREVTCGRLDRIASPMAFGTDRTKGFAIAREANHLAVKTNTKGAVRLVEEGIASADDKAKGGKTKSVFQAKEGRGETQPVLDLELVPVATNSDSFILMLHGKPLAKTEVHVYGPPRWGKELQTDAQGKVTLPLPWIGRYVVEVIHFEETAGGTGDDAYNRIRYVSATSFSTKKSLPWKAK